jgi:hypothetical protein
LIVWSLTWFWLISIVNERGNKAKDGGAIYTRQITPYRPNGKQYIEGTLITGNSATSFGGGIFYDSMNSTLLISNSTIGLNSAQVGGKLSW